MNKKIVISKKEEKKIDNKQLTPDDYLKLNNINTVNRLFLNECFENSVIIKNNIQKKRSSYKSQDIKKSRLTDDFITYDEVVEKLVISKLNCSYCKKDVVILYENKRDLTQWTLDRIDNELGHSNKNTVISCLKCNLQKRKRNDEKFRFTKQMNLIKIY